jgi:hypothetical protein
MQTLPRLTVIWVRTRIDTSGRFVLSSLSRSPLVPAWDIPHFKKGRDVIVSAAPTRWLIHALWRPFVTGLAAAPILWETILAIYHGSFAGSHRAFTPGRALSGDDIVASRGVGGWDRRRLANDAPPLADHGHRERRSRLYATRGVLLLMRL